MKDRVLCFVGETLVHFVNLPGIVDAQTVGVGHMGDSWSSRVGNSEESASWGYGYLIESKK